MARVATKPTTEEEARLREKHEDLEVRRVILDRTSSASTRNSCRKTTATGPTAADDPTAMRTDSRLGARAWWDHVRSSPPAADPSV
jgi:hypothetical protein